jgi:hypothetical protein
MIGWRMVIGIKQELQDDRPVIETGRAIASILEQERHRVSVVMRDLDEYDFCMRQLDEIISLMEDDAMEDDLNARLEELYDWGDEYRVLLNGTKPAPAATPAEKE